jgi:hypothetical protein
MGADLAFQQAPFMQDYGVPNDVRVRMGVFPRNRRT